MSESPTAPVEEQMTHREILEVLLGLMSALFIAIMSATIVSTALPTIIGDLEGTQTQYTWVVTASLLAMTVSSPIWAKLSDLYNKKLLVQVSILVFLVGSLAAGAVQDVPELLAARALQGLGMGGLVSLTQSIIGSIIPPRERGRYSGYMAATMAVATVSGPLIGGLLVDTLGWRWCFWAAVPFALVGLAWPTPRREGGEAWVEETWTSGPRGLTIVRADHETGALHERVEASREVGPQDEALFRRQEGGQ